MPSETARQRDTPKQVRNPAEFRKTGCGLDGDGGPGPVAEGTTHRSESAGGGE